MIIAWHHRKGGLRSMLWARKIRLLLPRRQGMRRNHYCRWILWKDWSMQICRQSDIRPTCSKNSEVMLSSNQINFCRFIGMVRSESSLETLLDNNVLSQKLISSTRTIRIKGLFSINQSKFRKWSQINKARIIRYKNWSSKFRRGDSLCYLSTMQITKADFPFLLNVTLPKPLLFVMR